MKRRIAIFLAGCAGLYLCMLFVDKPLAGLGWAAVGQTQFRGAADNDTPGFLTLTAIILLVCCRLRNLLLAAIAGTVAGAVNLALKHVFGRSSPDPTWFRYHQYGFHFFHASQHWESFPSGTLAVVSAVSLVLVRTHPRMRVPLAIFALFVCGIILVANGHWLSDILAGAVLGTFIGRQTLAWLGPYLLPDPDRPLDTSGEARDDASAGGPRFH